MAVMFSQLWNSWLFLLNTRWNCSWNPFWCSVSVSATILHWVTHARLGVVPPRSWFVTHSYPFGCLLPLASVHQHTAVALAPIRGHPWTLCPWLPESLPCMLSVCFQSLFTLPQRKRQSCIWKILTWRLKPLSTSSDKDWSLSLVCTLSSLVPACLSSLLLPLSTQSAFSPHVLLKALLNCHCLQAASLVTSLHKPKSESPFMCFFSTVCISFLGQLAVWSQFFHVFTPSLDQKPQESGGHNFLLTLVCQHWACCFTK